MTTATRIAVSGSNIAGADDPTRARKIANVVTGPEGVSQQVSITRATNASLAARLLGANAKSSGSQALLDGLERLHETVGDPQDGTSPAARLSALSSALQAYANAPSTRSLGQAVITAAQSLASSINGAAQTITAVRNGADSDMASSVANINKLLSDFESVNTQIVSGTLNGDDVTDAMDKRDALLGQISQEVGINVVQRANNDVAIYTDSGVTLFDKSPRTVAFTASSSLAPGADGNAVYIDGVPVTGANATMPIASGKLFGLATLRDVTAPTYQAQIDEFARGVVEAFAESDQSGGGGPDLAGLFTWSGGPALPATGTLSPGISISFKVNPAVIPAQGGDIDAIRDGGINGADYDYNIANAASFSDRLNSLVDGLSAARTFDTGANLGPSMSVLDFGTTSAGWLEDKRQTVSNAADYQGTLVTQVTTALSNAAGVNLDDEYAQQLQLEQSYQASSKLIGVIQNLFQTLMDAVA
jgi:flagellar hook-associated protein 1 FlgK